MIKKLRKKLLIASMCSLLIVLFIIEGIVSILNYRKIVQDADRILQVLEENEGEFPEGFRGQLGKDGKNQDGALGQMSPEIPYESRYFSVLLDSSGETVTVDTGKIASVDTDTAVEYAKSVLSDGKKRGFSGDYRYLVCESGSNIRIIFLDCGRSLSTFSNFVLTAFGVSVAGLIAVFVLMMFLSGRIVKPFLENFEKQKRFITDAGHELKTPLTIIDADAEVLEMDMGTNEWLQDIQSQTRRMTALTNDLILLARMEEEVNKELRVEFSLSDLLEESLCTFQSLAMTQNKTLTGTIAPMVSMWGDERAIRRLVMILLDNGVKYSDEEGRIHVTLERQKKKIVLSVFNTTEHISREQLKHLFDRFYRTDSSRNSQTGGYGLGLSIAAATVEGHRGKILAATKDERSLQITVIFPI